MPAKFLRIFRALSHEFSTNFGTLSETDREWRRFTVNQVRHDKLVSTLHFEGIFRKNTRRINKKHPIDI